MVSDPLGPGTLGCCLAPEAFKEGHSSDHGWTSPGFRPSHPKCVCVYVGLWTMHDSSKKLLTSTGRVQRCSSECMLCVVVIVFVGSVGGHALCLLCPVHNWARSREDGPMGVSFVSVPIIEAIYDLPKFGRLCVVSCM